jgi:hypothetical protein
MFKEPRRILVNREVIYCYGDQERISMKVAISTGSRRMDKSEDGR